MNSWQAKDKGRFGRFLIVGVLNTGLDFGLMNLFTQVLKWPLVASQAISFVFAVVNSFVLNRYWVYPESRRKDGEEQFVKFGLINLAGLGLRSILMPLFDRLFLWLVQATPLKNLPFTPQFISHNAALALVIPLTLLLNFLANRFWTFRSAVEEDLHG